MSGSTPLPIRLAQTLGITSSLMAAGLTLSFSTSTIPLLLQSPAPLLLKQWNQLYSSGIKINPPMALFSALNFFYLAYHSHASSLPSAIAISDKTWLYATAGLLAAGFVPYTIAVIAPTNGKLLGRADEMELKKMDLKAESVGGESVHQLVDRWALLNLGRAGLVLGSGVLGLWTVLN